MLGSTYKHAPSTLQLRQKLKQHKIVVLFRHLNVTGDLDLINLEQFMPTTDPKKGATVYEFYNGDK